MMGSCTRGYSHTKITRVLILPLVADHSKSVGGWMGLFQLAYGNFFHDHCLYRILFSNLSSLLEPFFRGRGGRGEGFFFWEGGD